MGGDLGGPWTPAEVARALRRHAGAVRDRHRADGRLVVRELMQMADALDGGRGEAVHHGCPDPGVLTADCHECALVLEAEVDDVPSVFAGTDLVPAAED